MAQGEYRKAEPLYERALAIREKALDPDHRDIAVSLNNLAGLCRVRGEYGKAELLYERALAIRKKALGPGHPDVATSLHDLAILYKVRGEYRKAEPLFEQARAIAEDMLGPDHPDVATSLNNLAALYEDQGEYGKAEPLFEQARAIYEKALGPGHPDVAFSLNNLAELYRCRGEYRMAEPLFEQARAIWEKTLGPDHPDVALSLNNLAGLYLAQGEHQKAEPLFKRALAIRERALGPDHLYVAISLNNLALVREEQGRHESALELHRQALDIQEKNIARAFTIAEETRRRAHASTLTNSTYLILSSHFQFAHDHHPTAELALTTVLRRKGRTLDLASQTSARLRASLPEEHQHLFNEISDLDAHIAEKERRGLSGEIRGLREKQDELWSELRKQGGALLQAIDKPIMLGDIQGVLPDDSVLVEIVKYIPRYDDAGAYVQEHEAKLPPRYAVYLLFRDRFDWIDLGPAEPIDEQVGAFRKALELNAAIPTELYDALMRPIVERIGETDRLIISPDGELNLIPFGAMYDGERYLIERYTLRYVTTGRDLLRPTPESIAITPITIVANPSGASLSGAENEADFLTSLFPDARVLEQAEATETNVRALERPLILHMATHGFFGEARNERDNPMLRSGLVLAEVQGDRELDDGQLTAYEVSGWDLRGTQLVVLSACETGRGAVEMGEGVLGLRRAFAMAGAQTQVMSLWKVGDVSALKVMSAYYLKLAKGKGRGEAMQAVQLEMLRTKEHAHPKDWAAFIVSGDDTPIVFPAGQAPHEVENDPPPTEGRSGCATRSSGRGAPTGSMLIGLLGLTALRRRSR